VDRRDSGIDRALPAYDLSLWRTQLFGYSQTLWPHSWRNNACALNQWSQNWPEIRYEWDTHSH